MPRPRKTRNCQEYIGDRVYKPRSIPMTDLERVQLGRDELEALRLCDVEQLNQDQAGERMGVSRGTIYRLLKSGRAKVTQAILNSQALIIEESAGPETDGAED